MNIIEQLGGYERANSKLLKMDKILKEVYYSHSDAQKANELRQALLEYRREHGIFEVGDRVVCLFGQDSTFLTKDEIYTVKEVCYGGTHVTLKLQENYDGGESSYSVNRFNHATDEEIKAGHRL